MTRYRLGLAVLLPAALGAAVAAGGCRRPEFAFYPVEGTVTRGGRPLPNIQVVFLADPDSGTVGPRATGATDAAGRYRLRTDQGDDGAVAGTHRVVLVDLEAARMGFGRFGGSQRKEVEGAPPKGGKRLADKSKTASRVPAEYGSINQTKLRARVGPEDGVFDVKID
jgi:hypothetical protein